ncbi:AglZ/HisF2 family acetamidino modification protein [Pusillimonas sp. SM2304]|uniref:AglZ/HisF2 family acetamidino modification protein n=1 Tax=Pusillimonas sp. SM2304 TaxID=3073241 RepID=UPI00287674C9|nr:AglZ/HisF2 family acetamidino modification protein [Pusillimonas sp. SM2304]MDS1140045.1 AglZ/HisF2 family acetamidino modification protein [Pusillimonas sp. SM2304]
MLATRVIPILLLKNTGLVKGVRFSNHKYVGDPVNAVKIFNMKEVDELVFLDITASVEGRKPNYELLADIASQAFMPFGYGGGLATLQDIEKLFKLGIEKAILNTAAIKDLKLIGQASKIVGSQSIVVSMDVKKNILGKYQIYSHSGSFNTKLDPVEYAKRAADAGAGELILCSIDREGTGRGYDIDIVERVAAAVEIPVVASGGAATLQHFKQAVDAGASAVAAGDMFTFHGKHKAVLITYPDYKKLEATFKDAADVK